MRLFLIKSDLLNPERADMGIIVPIDYHTAVDFILPKHYSGRIPTITKAFGWYSKEPFIKANLQAVCTFGKPVSNSLCVGICGESYASDVYELNRLCRTDTWDKPLSYFVSACLRYLSRYDWIVVSYSDTAMNHHGYIYQACNFLYTGMSKERTDMYVSGGKHSRHYIEEEQGVYRKIRSSKYRYVYFCTRDKSIKKAWRNALKYPIYPYPKGDNSYYKLGHYLVDKVIEISIDNS